MILYEVVNTDGEMKCLKLPSGAFLVDYKYVAEFKLKYSDAVEVAS